MTDDYEVQPEVVDKKNMTAEERLKAAEAKAQWDADAPKREAKRKRDYRARLKKEKEDEAKIKAASELPSWLDYWKENRTTLTNEQQMAYAAREEEVLDLEFSLKAHLNGDYEALVRDEPDFPPFTDLLYAVQEDVRVHGLLDEVVLIVPDLWKANEEKFRKLVLRKKGATATLVQFGYRLALSSRVYNELERFLQKAGPAPIRFSLLECESCNLPQGKLTVEEGWAKQFRQYGGSHKFECAACRTTEFKSREISRQATNIMKAAPTPMDVVYDSYGRLRDN